MLCSAWLLSLPVSPRPGPEADPLPFQSPFLHANDNDLDECAYAHTQSQ